MNKNKNRESEHSQTASSKCEVEEFKAVKKAEEDNDGEKKDPNKRTNLITTSMLIAKAMIGSGVLNCPLVFKTLGIIPGILVCCSFNIMTTISIYFLMKTKDITQHYSYAYFSKLTMGFKGSIITKIALIVMTGTKCCVYLKIFGDLLRGIISTFVVDKDSPFTNAKYLIVISAVCLLPMMFKKDITAISKFAILGIIAVIILCISIIILYTFKLKNNQIQPFDMKMLYPSTNSFQSIFICFAGFYSAFSFQYNTFPIYLPLHPRNSKNMIIATFMGCLFVSILYIVIGSLGYSIYRDKLENSLLIYFKDDLVNFIKTNKYMAAVLYTCHGAYFLNTSISLILIYFSTKNNLFNLIIFITKSSKSKKKDDGQTGTPLVDKKPEDDVEKDEEKGEEKDEEKNKEKDKKQEKKQEKEGLSEGVKIFLTIAGYCFVTFIALITDKIIILDGFNSATVGNYITSIAPALFFLITHKKNSFGCGKIMGYMFILYGFMLMSSFFIVNIQKLMKK